MRSRNTVLGGVAVAVLMSLLTAPASAAVVTMDLNYEHTGGTNPAGTQPWIRVTLDDGGSTGSVQLKINALNLVGSEFVTDFLMNLDPTLAPASLAFSAPTKVGSFADPVIAKGVNAFNAGGGSSFDLQLSFDNAPPANRFGVGESVTYTITGIPTLDANSFSFQSVGGSGPIPISAHVQGIGTSGQFSGWITNTPEPTTLAAALGAIGFVSRRRRA